jgi:hypothetical protein
MIILNHIGKAFSSPNLTIICVSGGVVVSHTQVAAEKRDEVPQHYYILPSNVREALHCPGDVDEFEIVGGKRRWCHCTNHVGIPMFEVRTMDAGPNGIAPLLMLDKLYSTMTDEEAKVYSVVAVFNTEQVLQENMMHFGAIRWVG